MSQRKHEDKLGIKEYFKEIQSPLKDQRLPTTIQM